MSSQVKSNDEAQMPLPKLREDLIIEPAGSFLNGSPSWLIHDPVRGQFFRIGQSTLELLSLWKSVSLEQFSEFASKHLQKEISTDEIEELVKFAFANNLTVEPAGGDYTAFAKQQKAKQKGLLSTLTHSYLFFRIPLFNPQPILDFMWPFMRLFFTRTTLIALAFLMVVSLYLVSRQWEVFTSTFLSFLSFEGALFYGVSLVLLKFLHEFGHAFMAKKYNVSVPIIGVAFLVLFPVLYTSTTAAVRLKSRKNRLMINMAGIMVELAVAIIATLFWVFLPDGPMRSIAFTTASLSWALSLLVNLNPFMRFDGYYILSDALGVENLQERSFAFAKWRMREALFKPNLAPPEIINTGLRKILTYHAWGTWIYRFFLFLGIALLVYSFFIKVIGIVLFVIEIVWFILLPVWREIKFCWKNKGDYKTMRSVVSGFLFFLVLGALFVPWSSRVDVPAVIKASNEYHIYPPLDGKIINHNLKEKLSIRQGEILFELASPKLDADIRISDKRKQLLQTRLNRAAASEVELASLTILQAELDAENQNNKGLKTKKTELVFRAPFTGTLTNVDRELHEAQWLSSKNPVSILIDQSSIQSSGLASAESVSRMKIGQMGYFIADGFFQTKIPVKVSAISEIAEATLNDDILSETEGGLVPVTSGHEAESKLLGTWFRIELEITNLPDDFNLSSEMRGVAIIKAEPKSFASRIFRQIASVLIRESGF